MPVAFADTGLIRTYQEYYVALEQGHLDTVPTVTGGELTSDQTPGVIGSTWDLSLDLLDARQLPEARRLLRLMATFADAPLPYQLLLDAGTMSASTLFEKITGPRLWQVLQALDGFGLIDLETDGSSIGSDNAAPVLRLHPLIRDTSYPRPDVPGEERAAYLDLAARLLQRAAKQQTGLPEDPPTWPVWQLLAPHALEVFTVLESEPGCPGDAALAAADAAELAARYRAEQRLHAEAEAVLRGVTAVREDNLGADHPDTLDTRHGIARRMVQRRDFSQAQTEFREVLAARLRVLGPDHPETLGTRHSIARTMAALGDYAGAQAEFREVLAIRMEILGPEHPRTLGTRHEIARTMAALGDYAGAQAEFREVLAIQLHVLGPTTCTPRHPPRSPGRWRRWATTPGRRPSSAKSWPLGWRSWVRSIRGRWGPATRSPGRSRRWATTPGLRPSSRILPFTTGTRSRPPGNNAHYPTRKFTLNSPRPQRIYAGRRADIRSSSRR